MEEQLINKTGVVTFLDVLGWKGIWQRKDNPIKALKDLREKLKSNAQKYSKGRDNVGDTSVLSISDTIVLLTDVLNNQPTNALDLHGQLCSEILLFSLELGIPIRGATGYGEFSANETDSVFVGKAIDETASWHEQADWIGVFMTPSAFYLYENENSKWWLKYNPPIKNNLDFETFVAIWNDLLTKEKTANEIAKNFSVLSPIIPEIINKFSNTHKFLQFLESSEKVKNNFG